jgi:hypothetical protein
VRSMSYSKALEYTMRVAIELIGCAGALVVLFILYVEFVYLLSEIL